MHLELWQWILGGTAAILVGISKTGVPGAGILVVTMLATAFGGRAAMGIMLTMLIFADVFAVVWYRRHAQWGTLIRLFPGVAVGMPLGAAALWATGNVDAGNDVLARIIGVLVLIMLAVHLLQGWLGERLTPRSKTGMAATGTAVGFVTVVANIAGAIMVIYLAAHRVTKHQFIGTMAWYFFIINLTKVPVYVALSAANPSNPIITSRSLLLAVAFSPAIATGALIGKWLLPRIPESAFTATVLVFAGAAAIKLIAW